MFLIQMEMDIDSLIWLCKQNTGIELHVGGGSESRYDVFNTGGVLENMTNSDKGREGVKSPNI